MPETIFQELKRYVCFGPPDERALERFLPVAATFFPAITDSFYQRIKEHPDAHSVFESEDQVQRLHGSLCDWLELLFRGPWDEAYYAKRARVGQMHLRIGLPQRYLFCAMNLIRVELLQLAELETAGASHRVPLQTALNKILDLELAIMLESHSQAFVAHVQHDERVEREALAQQLALSEARHHEIVEKAEALISTADPTGQIVLFNAKCEQLTGVSREAARSRSWLELFVQASDREEVARLLQQVTAGGPALTYEGPVQTSSPTLQRRVRWHFTALPGGSDPALCAIGIDITNEYELAVRTRRAERLAALGTMAAGLAHEIRNPLNSAHLQLSVARRRLTRVEHSDHGSIVRAIDLAEVEMKRLANLVQDFLQFAKPQPLRLSQLDLRQPVRAVVDFMTPEAKAAGVSIQLESTDPVTIEVDEEKVKQVLLNLLRNAIEATGPGGRVTVGVRQVAAMGEVTIEDDGPGWPPDAPIFEPFYTTKDAGTGLGLAIVHRIVMDHGGTLDAVSRPGRAAFTMQFPRAHLSATQHA